MASLSERLAAERERVYHYVCDHCGWDTTGLNAYLAHKCDPGLKALRRYQRAAEQVIPDAPDSTSWAESGFPG